MPPTDDTLCADLLTALNAADRTGDHTFGHRARAIVSDLTHDLTLRARLREAITQAIATPDPEATHHLRRILASADEHTIGWQAEAYEALDDE